MNNSPPARQAELIVPSVDPESVARELRARAELVRQEILRLEEAKRVSQETMWKVIDF